MKKIRYPTYYQTKRRSSEEDEEKERQAKITHDAEMTRAKLLAWSELESISSY
jgi:hypothetical protein